MTTIAVTDLGTVTGSNPELVAAAVAAMMVAPAPRGNRMDDLVAAVRVPWARVAVSW
jgi:hypothetical protein